MKIKKVCIKLKARANIPSVLLSRVDMVLKNLNIICLEVKDLRLLDHNPDVLRIEKNELAHIYDDDV